MQCFLDVYSTYLNFFLNFHSFHYFFQVRKVLKGVKVEANHQGVRRYKITGLSNQPVRDITYVINLGTLDLYKTVRLYLHELISFLIKRMYSFNFYIPGIGLKGFFLYGGCFIN